MKLLQTKIAARVAFYLGGLSLFLSALSISLPDWHAVGVTPLGLLKAADTWFLMTIAILLAQIADNAGPKT